MRFSPFPSGSPRDFAKILSLNFIHLIDRRPKEIDLNKAPRTSKTERMNETEHTHQPSKHLGWLILGILCAPAMASLILLTTDPGDYGANAVAVMIASVPVAAAIATYMLDRSLQRRAPIGKRIALAILYFILSVIAAVALMFGGCFLAASFMK